MSNEGQILWRSDCAFLHDSVSITDRTIESNTAEECGQRCLNRPMTCNHFSHQNSKGDCDLMAMWFHSESNLVKIK